MALDDPMLEAARRARDRLVDLEYEAGRARLAYQHAVRRLHSSGGSLREIAEALGVSHQRVHQIVDAAPGRIALKASPPRRACGFCGAGGDEVLKMIAGPGVCICDGCVDDAWAVLRGEARSRAPLAAVDPADRLRCSFCGRRIREAAGMVAAPGSPASPAGKPRPKYGGPGVRVCRECLGLCREIISGKPAP